MNCSILARNSVLEAKLLRRRSLRTRMENQISIWLSQEACLGVKWKTMRCVGSQELFARLLGREHAAFALDAQSALDAAGACNQANHRFGEVDVEVVADDVPARVGGGAVKQVAEKSREVLLAAGISDHALDLAGGDVEGGDQRLSAVTAIFELVPFDLARHHGLVRRNAFQGLDTGLLVDRDDAMGLVGSRRSLVDRTDIGALGIEGGIGLRGQPVPKAMRFEVGLFFKKRPTERCEMFGTRPRRIASSAISRWLQWLMGRSLASGFSHVIATIAQTCSGVYVARAPGRGASTSRSGTDTPTAAVPPRLRQRRTVFGHTSSSSALSRTPTPSAASNMMRARRANCCGVEWVRTSCSSISRCSDETVTGSAANRGMTTSHLSSGFVMPQHERFGLWPQVRQNDPPLSYHRTCRKGGVAKSARRN